MIRLICCASLFTRTANFNTLYQTYLSFLASARKSQNLVTKIFFFFGVYQEISKSCSKHICLFWSLPSFPCPIFLFILGFYAILKRYRKQHQNRFSIIIEFYAIFLKIYKNNIKTLLKN